MMVQNCESLDCLNKFFRAIENDGRISITHIGIYAALLQYWQGTGYSHPLVVFSHQIMEIAKISTTTYHRCIRQLHEYGYIRYEPSFKRNKASEIYLHVSD